MSWSRYIFLGKIAELIYQLHGTEESWSKRVTISDVVLEKPKYASFNILISSFVKNTETCLFQYEPDFTITVFLPDDSIEKMLTLVHCLS